MLTHKGTVTLKTKRLTLRRLTEDDAEAMYKNWATDSKTTQYLSWEPYTDIGELRKFIAGCVAAYEKQDCYHWAIEYGGEPVGTVNLHDLSARHGRAELGYCLGSKWWNAGIMTEAVSAVMDFAFTELGADKICAFHDVQNAASGRVMEKNGMTQEGILREHNLRKDGSRGDFAFYGILKEEWRAGKW